MSSNWKTLHSESGPDLKLFKVRWDEMQNQNNGNREKMVILESPDSVNVIALSSEGEIILVKQFRFGTHQTTFELPGGIVEANETSLQGAQRELREETGYTGGQWQYLGSVPSNPVFMDSRIHHWLAKGLKKTQDLELDHGEDIEVIEIPQASCKEWLKEGKIEHPHSISAFMKWLF